VALRKTLLLSLNDRLVVTREFIHPEVSRSGPDRCLRRHGVADLKALLPKEEGPKTPVKTFSKKFHAIIRDLTSSYLILIPGSAPASGLRIKRSLPPGPAARTMPSERPKRILRGARLATMTVYRPTSSAGS